MAALRRPAPACDSGARREGSGREAQRLRGWWVAACHETVSAPARLTGGRRSSPLLVRALKTLGKTLASPRWAVRSFYLDYGSVPGGERQSPIGSCPAVKRVNRCSSVSGLPSFSHFLMPASSIRTYQREASSDIAPSNRACPSGSMASVYPLQ
jgi:hypothetical protein